LELYKESKTISERLIKYLEQEKTSLSIEGVFQEPEEPPILLEDIEIVYSCINDLLTKFFEEIGIKYYYNIRLSVDIPKKIHGLILDVDRFGINELDPSIWDKIKAIQIIFSEDMSNNNIQRICEDFQSSSMILMIVGIKWPVDKETQIIEVSQTEKIKYPENIKVVHYEFFAEIIGLKGDYEVALKETIDLFEKSELEILQDLHNSSTVKMHDTEELLQDLKEKGLIEKNLEEYFNK